MNETAIEDELVEPGGEVFDLDRIEAVASALDLRAPNREALKSIVLEVGQHYEIDGGQPPFEAVVDAATGVGKTFILAGAIEYFAGQGVRNFLVITPGTTILRKTVANFTPGDPKSLLGGMSVAPVVITSDTFNTAAMREAMDDPLQVKLFIFSVQSLIKPTSKASRKTRKFQEGLGEALYSHLEEADDLFVVADEHHAYYGKAFSGAVRDLHPRVLIGLTATPHKDTPEEQIIYRYPLAAAIADKLVKTPVLVGRRDDRADSETKLADGITLLELKEKAVKCWCQTSGAKAVHPLMLVIAKQIDEAEEVTSTLESPSFAEGRYQGKVLTVHSNAPDEALAALERVEGPDSPYRIIVSVGMLKEGWDVKSVYVICSLRASVSELLTEQTLGRGLRLPFGEYTDIEILDTLEVLAHERYEKLLEKAGALSKETFIDTQTRAVLRRNAEGRLVARRETTTVGAPAEALQPPPSTDDDAPPTAPSPTPGQPAITELQVQETGNEQQLTALQAPLAPRTDFGQLEIPKLRMTPVQSDFSLADIIDVVPFKALGESIAADPEAELRRTAISARIIEGDDGLKRTELVTSPAADRVVSEPTLFPEDELRSRLLDQVLLSQVVPSRPRERAAAAPLIEALFDGLGEQAQPLLSRYFDRVAARLIALIARAQREVASKPEYQEVVEVIPFQAHRIAKGELSHDRTGAFRKTLAFEYSKSLYAQDWFDSSTERTVANLLDEAAEISFFIRLQRKDLPILWAEGREYNPDFIAVENSGDRYVVEVKMDKEMTSETVVEKRAAAKRWANHVNADPKIGNPWSYLLVSEADVKAAKGSWAALKHLGS
jgi:type III restriction enzyme